jgi:hypothetical protein
LKVKVDELKKLSQSHKTNAKSCKYIVLMNLFLGCVIFVVALIAMILKPELIPMVQRLALKK